MDDLWDIGRVATYLGVSERTVYNKVRSGDLPAIKVGRLWRVRERDLQTWLTGSATGACIVAESGAVPPRAELERLLAPIADSLERRLAFVGLLSSGVEALGWPPPVVVGGHAVEFYTAGGYTTVDIDLAGASEPVAQVLGSWEFEREGRHWFDDQLGLVVEVPGGQLTPSALDHAVSLRIGRMTALIIGIEDLVVDRLAACEHWHHAESCEWAVRMLAVADDLDQEYLGRRAAQEQVEAALARAWADAKRS